MNCTLKNTLDNSKSNKKENKSLFTNPLSEIISILFCIWTYSTQTLNQEHNKKIALNMLFTGSLVNIFSYIKSVSLLLNSQRLYISSTYFYNHSILNIQVVLNFQLFQTKPKLTFFVSSLLISSM